MINTWENAQSFHRSREGIIQGNALCKESYSPLDPRLSHGMFRKERENIIKSNREL
jgi:hypothetical protein